MTVEVLYLVLLVICLFLSVFLSSSETAYISLDRIKLAQMISNKEKNARRVENIIKRPSKFLSTVLLGNNLVQTAAAALATTLAISAWGQGGIWIATIIVTIVLMVFAEATPKTVAAHHAEKLALAYSRPMEWLTWLFTPFVAVLSWIASSFNKLLGAPSTTSLVTESTIRAMISMGHKDGTVEKEEAEMLHKVFDFGNRPVREVMVPRPDVIAFEQGSKISDFLALYAVSPVSRFPVYQENMDNVMGILSIKDVLMSMAKEEINNESLVDGLVRPAYFTPETKPIGDLFTEMRDNNFHMAVVVDEYGGTAGVVSLSRLMEEIVGPVGNELSSDEKDFEAINEYTFQIDGNMRIEEVNEEMGLDLPEGDYETIAGFILHILGHIPKPGEHLWYKGMRIVISKMQGVKIEEVLLTKERSTVKDAKTPG